ncbi:MAG: response regulator transcription factor [Bacteroidia bacterium]|nr:response regulator transcription factor [Bacteroidia bacterium]
MINQLSGSVIIADDHALMRDGINNAIKSKFSFDHTYICKDGKEVIDLFDKSPNKHVRLIILDLNMPVLNGTLVTEWLKKHQPHVKIIILSMHDESGYVLKLYDLGVDAYLLKDSCAEDLNKAIEVVLDGGSYFSEPVKSVMFNTLVRRDKIKPEKVIITAREAEILRLICEQKSSKQIGDQLCLSPLTVKRHRQQLMEKTNSENVVGLALYSIKHNIYKVY